MSTQLVKFLFAGMTLGFSAQGWAFDWKACDKDLKKNCPTAKGDEQIFECLEKVESKLSKPCYDAHEKYEDQQGKEEKNEKHEKGEKDDESKEEK